MARQTVRANACDISPKVRREVLGRDKVCIICGRVGEPNAHYIRRSQNGLGIKENVVTLCGQCHNEQHFGKRSEEITAQMKPYLDKLYPDFPDSKRIYDKWAWTKED